MSLHAWPKHLKGLNLVVGRYFDGCNLQIASPHDGLKASDCISVVLRPQPQIMRNGLEDVLALSLEHLLGHTERKLLSHANPDVRRQRQRVLIHHNVDHSRAWRCQRL